MMDINKYFVRVYNDAIYIKMILIFLITYGFVFEVIQKLYSTYRNFKKNCIRAKIAFKAFQVHNNHGQ